VYFCHECSLHLCEECHRHHLRSRRTGGHSTTMIAIALPPPPASSRGVQQGEGAQPAARARAGKAKAKKEAGGPAEKGEPRRRNRVIATAQRRDQRARQNALVTELDSILPVNFKGKRSANGAGNRSLGAAGRSLQDVLRDAIEQVRSWHFHRAAQASLYPAQDPPLSAAVELGSSVFRHGIQNSQTLAALQVSIPGWEVMSASLGAKHFFGSMPFLGIVGQCLLNGFVHPDDEGELEVLWERACAGARGGGKSACLEAGCASDSSLGGGGCPRMLGGEPEVLCAPARGSIRMLVTTALDIGAGSVEGGYDKAQGGGAGGGVRYAKRALHRQ